MTTTIEVTAIRPPKEGKKMFQVVDKDGPAYWTFPNVANTMVVGKLYACEVEEKTLDGRPFRSIKKVKEVGGEVATPQTHASAASVANTPNAEAAFVGNVLNGALIGGHIKFEANELARATRLLQMLYSQSFGGHNTFRASEASALSQYRGTQQ